MLRKALFLIILFFAFNNFSYAKIDTSQTLLTVGNEKISFGELKRAFEKTSMRRDIVFEDISKDSLMDFINLYANYKLKVIDGVKRKIHEDSTVVAEIKENYDLLAESYLFNKNIVEPAVEYYLDLRKTDKKIALIMTTFRADGDTTEAYQKIHSALKEIENGGTFEFSARKYSADSSTAVNGGVLPLYITGLKIQRKLEDALVKLKVGEYTKEPVRTDFGYFLIKLLEEKPREIIMLSHILLPFQTEADIFNQKSITKEDTLRAKKMADSVYKFIEAGENFNELANKFSGDKPSLAEGRGGFLGIYSRSTGLATTGDNLIQEVETEAYRLKDKEISKPILSKYGYHIIRRDSTITYDEREEVKESYRRLYYANDEQKYLDSLAVAICNYSLNNKSFKLLVDYADNNKTALDTNFAKRIPEDIKALELYSILGKKYTVDNFIQNLITKPELKIVATNEQGFEKAIKLLIRPIVIAEATKDIENAYPEFKIMMREFRDGIILFRMEALNVWNRLKFDTTLAKKFYDTTKMDLTRPAYYDISEIYMLSNPGIKKIREEIIQGKISFDSAAALHTQRNNYRDKKGHHGNLYPEKYKLAEIAETLKLKKNDISEPFEYETGYSIIKINDFQPSRRKTFEEAIPDISGAVQALVQKQLEERWIKDLKQRYRVVFNKNAINSIFNRKK